MFLIPQSKNGWPLVRVFLCDALSVISHITQTLTLVVFGQLRKYATIVRGLCAAVRGFRHDNHDDLS